METVNIGTVFLGLDNYLDVVLEIDGEPVEDLSTVEMMALVDVSCAWMVDSSDSPEAFDWSAGEGVLRLALGGEDVQPGNYSCYLIVFDPAYPDGLLWGSKYKITFKNVCMPT